MATRVLPEILLETPDSLKDWLKSKKPGTVVGERQESDRCPLARFLSEVGGLIGVSVTDVEVWFEKQEGEETQVLGLPKWAQSFVEQTDGDGSPHRGITARTALRCL